MIARVGAVVVSLLCLLSLGSAAAHAGNSGQRSVSWHVVAAPHPANLELQSVACSSPRWCVAVGTRRNLGKTMNEQRIAIERWNGSRWAVMDHPSLPTVAYPEAHGVACASARACVMVGSRRDARSGGLAEVWNGRRWRMTSMSTPTGSLQTSEMAAVDCASATRCLAVGTLSTSGGGPDRAIAETWNGRRWTSVRPHLPPGAREERLTGVACPRVTWCLVVGDLTYGSYETRQLALVWDGSSWHRVRMHGPSSAAVELGAVDCTAIRSCVAVGDYLRDEVTDVPFSGTLHGTTWKWQRAVMPRHKALVLMTGVSCLSARNCWAVGTAEKSEVLAQHWNGRTWTAAQTPTPSPATFDAVTCVPRLTCIAAGSVEGAKRGLASWIPLLERR